MKKTILAIVVAGTLAAVTPTTYAKDGTAFSAALLTNYVFRGITLTNNGFAVQGTAEMTKGNLMLGGFASNINNGAEIDLYGSYAISSINVGAIYYLNSCTGCQSTTEINVGGKVQKVDWKVSYDFTNKSTYVEGAGAIPLSKDINLDLHAGVNSATTTTTDLLAGVSGEFKGLGWALAATNHSTDGSHIYALVKKNF